MSQALRRLYSQFEPESYRLSLHPDKTAMSFSGSVNIIGKKTGRPAKRIVLHAKKLRIRTAKLVLIDKGGAEREIKLARTVMHSGYDELRLHSEELLYGGSYRIELEFSGKITRPMEGLYPCFYEQDAKQEIILATQFESHHAREVFPCVDEPEAKAVFELSLIAPKEDTVLANTELRSKKPDAVGLNVEYIFEPTPKMSTYLLAFIIGKIDYLESKTSSGIRVRTYARPDQVPNTRFALDTATRCLDFYNAYFDIDYPLNKCDLIALPDFASGAMENWGLITFREQALIVDDLHTSLNMKQYVANVVAHELTHQWFGNLVTMRWWNDLWLNESFASLMSYVALDTLFPDWQMWTQFIVDEQAPALKLDALEYTHPINVVIRHPDEIRTIFDNISYEKGASVLYMLMRYIGEADFRAGLAHYLKRHAYSNTESADLWRAWEEAAKKPVKDFMSTWTTQAGYPLLHAKVGATSLEVTQSRFYLSPKAKRVEEKWPVPLLPSTKLDLALLSTKETKLKLDHDRPLVLNQGRSAFCRVVYDSQHLKSLTKLVSNQELSELDRLGLLSDSFEAAKAGLGSTLDATRLLEAYKDEDNVVVWEVLAGNIGALRSVIVGDDETLRRIMNPSIHKLIAKQYARLGWDEQKSDSHFDKLLRPIILGLACMSDHPEALKQDDERYAKRATQPIHPDIRSVIYPTIARRGGKAEFDDFLSMHNASDNSEERLTLAAALTNFEQPLLIARALDLIKTDQVRLQDVAYWISDSFANRHAKLATWEWLKVNWQWLEQNLGSDLSFFMMPRYVARAFSDLDFLKDFESFFKARLNPSAMRPLNQAIETITWQALWKERDQAEFAKYYKS